MSLFVDTSVWSLAFRRDAPTAAGEAQALVRAIQAGELLFTTGIVLQELLQGFSGPKAREQILDRFAAIPLIVTVGVGTALVWATYDLPAFGLAETPINQHVVPYYFENAIKDTTVINLVSAILADYRGYDTLGETTVVFTAGIGVLLLLKGRPPRRTSGAPPGDGGGA